MSLRERIEDMACSVQRIVLASFLVFVFISGLHSCVADMVLCAPYDRDPVSYVTQPEVCKP